MVRSFDARDALDRCDYEAHCRRYFLEMMKGFAKQIVKLEGNRVIFHAADLASHNLVIAYTRVGLEREVDSA